jgi:hypothetical protein
MGELTYSSTIFDLGSSWRWVELKYRYNINRTISTIPSVHAAWNGRIGNEWWIEMDLKANGHGLIKFQSRHLYGPAGKLGQDTGFRSRFELSTFRVQDSSANDMPTSSGPRSYLFRVLSLAEHTRKFVYKRWNPKYQWILTWFIVRIKLRI